MASDRGAIKGDFTGTVAVLAEGLIPSCYKVLL